jgi:hypothetical protein
METQNLLAHTKPTLTPLLRQLLSSKRRNGRWPKMGSVTRGQISRHLDVLEVWKKPLPSDEIVGRVVTMMQHYYTPESYLSIRREQYIDWGELLQEVPGFAFTAACGEWIKRHTRRPTPADILKLAEQLAGSELREYFDLKDAYKNAPELGDTEPTFDSNGKRIGGEERDEELAAGDTWEDKRQRWIARMQHDPSLVPDGIKRLFHLHDDGTRKPQESRFNKPRDHTGDPFYEKFNNARYRKDELTEAAE